MLDVPPRTLSPGATPSPPSTRLEMASTPTDARQRAYSSERRPGWHGRRTFTHTFARLVRESLYYGITGAKVSISPSTTALAETLVKVRKGKLYAVENRWILCAQMDGDRCICTYLWFSGPRTVRSPQTQMQRAQRCLRCMRGSRGGCACSALIERWDE